MFDILHACFSGPVLPASVLLLLVCGYWLLVILGAMDLDLFDFDVDLDVGSDADVGWFGSMGAVTLRFLNVGKIPFMVWLSVMAIVLWVISVVWYDPAANHDNWLGIQVFLRNVVLSVLGTKILTQPLTRLVTKTELTQAKDLLGRQCVIATSEATPQHGQARLPTEAAPLLLHVRTLEGSIPKGELATIVDFDPVKLIYYVEKAKNEVVA